MIVSLDHLGIRTVRIWPILSDIFVLLLEKHPLVRSPMVPIDYLFDKIDDDNNPVLGNMSPDGKKCVWRYEVEGLWSTGISQFLFSCSDDFHSDWYYCCLPSLVYCAVRVCTETSIYEA